MSGKLVTTGIEITFNIPAASDVKAIAAGITELAGALDDLHRAKGGSGLNVEFNVNGKPTAPDDLVGSMLSQALLRHVDEAKRFLAEFEKGLAAVEIPGISWLDYVSCIRDRLEKIEEQLGGSR